MAYRSTIEAPVDSLWQCETTLLPIVCVNVYGHGGVVEPTFRVVESILYYINAVSVIHTRKCVK